MPESPGDRRFRGFLNYRPLVRSPILSGIDPENEVVCLHAGS